MDLRTDQERIRLMLGASTDADTHTHTLIECNSNTNNTTLFKEVHFKDNVRLGGGTVTLPVTSDGIIFDRPNGNTWPTMTIKDTRGAFQFFNRKFNCFLNASNFT